MSVKQTLQERKAKKKALLKEMLIAAKAAFKEMSQEVFEKNPTLVSFSWTQFTPYFNDGETCYFSASIDEPQMVFCVEGNEEEVERWDLDGKLQTAAFEAIHEFLGQFDSSDFEEMFGDHVKVTVNKKGVDIDEYESHD